MNFELDNVTHGLSILVLPIYEYHVYSELQTLNKICRDGLALNLILSRICMKSFQSAEEKEADPGSDSGTAP